MNAAALEYAQRPRLDEARGGHYESWFLRANHPREPRAFWIRYTLFVPAQPAAPRFERFQQKCAALLRPEPRRNNNIERNGVSKKSHFALGEMWAVYFDRGRPSPIAAQEDIPWSDCRVQADPMDIDLGTSRLRSGNAQGQARGIRHHLQWQLQYDGAEKPLLLLPAPSYDRAFPKAKALVSRPLVRFNGHLVANGERIPIDDWIGSENHNWGQRHTDAYAWGQVCGFDNDASAFLECSSARLKLGPFWSPLLTLAVLRCGGQTFAFNRLQRAWRQRADYGPGHWSFTCVEDRLRLDVQIGARAQETVALRYRNPPGGVKTCLNSKLARCELVLERPDKPVLRLQSASGAAFEILTDAPPPDGVYAN